MAIVKPSKPYTFIDGPGNTAVGAEVNENFDTIYSKIGEVIDAVNNAAGTKATLDARLDVALNEDGTQKTALTAGGEWINPGFTATYISANQFSVPGDQRDIYQAGRRVKVGLAASTVYSAVSASTHGAGITTVTVGSVLTNPIGSVEHGIVTPDNGSSSLPTDFMTTTATAGKGAMRTATGQVKAANAVAPDDAATKAQLDLKADTTAMNSALSLKADSSAVNSALALKFDAAKVYHGRITNAGTVLRLPAGWTVVRNSTGVYTLTHNLGTDNYTPIIGGGSGQVPFRKYYTRDANTVIVQTFDLSSVAADKHWTFMILVD